ncbi:type II toxin-antitoxin system HicB family antitoxin [Candidatus Roizmanbacteria bacterium]|nr:type II toxin-antitoxin system HicB family antitoxin [Candidatus Roizmanbacteria bacterium]
MKTSKRKSTHFQVINNGIVLDFIKEPEGGYTVTVPSLPGCVSYGKTFEEAIEMIKDATEGYLKVAKEEGLLWNTTCNYQTSPTNAR